MRVIAGLYKGRTLTTVSDLSVRPATDRVKQTLFDVLSTRLDLDGASVLDLFAGSGALGIEALSRGAARVVFVENNRHAVEHIVQNARKVGCEDAIEVEITDSMDYLESAKETYDLIFADPPYEFEATGSIPNVIFGSSLLARHGYLLIEHARTLRFEDTAEYTTGPVKKFGRTLVTFFHHPSPSNGEKQ